jgi:hypothetical protein
MSHWYCRVCDDTVNMPPPGAHDAAKNAYCVVCRNDSADWKADDEPAKPTKQASRGRALPAGEVLKRLADIRRGLK